MASSVRVCLLRLVFNQQFKAKDMGHAEEFLIIRISQQPYRIIIDQEQYIRTLLVKYRLYIGSCNCADVPSISEYKPRNKVPANPEQQSLRISRYFILMQMRILMKR